MTNAFRHSSHGEVCGVRRICHLCAFSQTMHHAFIVDLCVFHLYLLGLSKWSSQLQYPQRLSFALPVKQPVQEQPTPSSSRAMLFHD